MIRRHSRWSLLIPARSGGRISIVLWFILFGAIYAVAFSKDISYPPEVASALIAAGDNHHKLEKVLSHYSKERDSLKFRAACYLIANMEGHSYVTYKLCDTTGAEVPFNALCYSDYNILIAAFDSLEIQKGILDFKRKEIFDDLKSVKSDFLIKHIDYAFRAWQEKPWARQLSFDQFCRYILPYRGSNEPLELWRKYFWDKYRGLET
ncbi:MAG: hypothetical protein NTV06_00095, partial [candidate division Zixibacteria bacterium]|nr:hypothetical protein [candidate division Zixibacteria bacterium]